VRPYPLTAFGGLAALALLAGSCAVGERPTLASTPNLGGAPGTPVGDAGVDRVLGLLESVPAAAPPAFTAGYAVTRRLGPLKAPAQVVRDGDRVSVTIGDIRYLTGPVLQTCTVSTGRCEAGLDKQRTSDITVWENFYASAPATALRSAYVRKSGAPTPSQQTVAGQPAECVDVPVGPGRERYCALVTGPVAVWDTADKQVLLTTYAATADPAAFEPAGAPGS